MESILFASGILLLIASIAIFRLSKRHLCTFTAILAVLSCANLPANNNTNGKGLVLPSNDTLDYVEKKWPTIAGVRPNKVGLERIQHHRKSQGLTALKLQPAANADEFIVVIGKQAADTAEASEYTSATSLPPSVDNSQLPSFPNIGDQNQLESCVAWATSYYQASHEHGLLNGNNNKTSSTTVFSPKWTYNNLNEGRDSGLSIFSSYKLLNQNGVATLSNLPYDNNYLAWDLHALDWVTALQHRTAHPQVVHGIGGAAQNLNIIKQLLNNGHVLTFGTCIDSWVQDTIMADPAAASNPHAGEFAAAWQNGAVGPHCMTIVGYDDNVWVDINKNGVVDQGEKGAFLVANSWGPDWWNKGFAWVAYDAFLSHSAVADGPNSGREPIAGVFHSKVLSSLPLAASYIPKLVAKFSLTQSLRNQISIFAGVSNTSTATPEKIIDSVALKNQGGEYGFDGTQAATDQTATFALDLTDVMSTATAEGQRYYLIVKDNREGNPTTLNSFELVDIEHANVTVPCTNTPVTFDNSKVTRYVDYHADSEAHKPNTAKISITSPHKNQQVTDTFWVTAAVTGPEKIASVEFYVDGTLHSTDTAPPYHVLLDTKDLNRGRHIITAIARTTDNESVSSEVTVSVNKPKPPRKRR